MWKANLCLWITAFHFSNVQTQDLTKRHVVLYNDVTDYGSKFYIKSIHNEPDLRVYPNLFTRPRPGKYICYLGGFIMYETNNYGDDGSTFWGQSPWTNVTRCYISHTNLISFKFLGFEDVTLPSFSTFEKYDFRGEMIAYSTSQPNLDVSFAGIYITGGERWSIFQEPNYGGRGYCIDKIYPNITQPFDIQPGGIKSIKLGC